MKNKIIVLGVGNCFTPEITNSSYLFIREDNGIDLIDCGYNVFTKLKIEFPNELKHLSNVYITHLHPDHVGSLPALILYRYCMYGLFTNIAIASDLIDLLDEYLKSTTSCCSRSDLASFLLEPSPKLYTIHPSNNFFPVLHGITPAFGLRYYNILFTGDSFFLPSGFKLLSDSSIKYIFHDTCLSSEFNLIHSQFELFPKHYSKRILEKIVYVHHGIDSSKLPNHKFGTFVLENDSILVD